MSNLPNFDPSIQAIRRLSNRYDATADGIQDFMRAHMAGEEPDPQAFTDLLAQRSVTKSAMQAMVKLHEKPLKTVLTETR